MNNRNPQTDSETFNNVSIPDSMGFSKIKINGTFDPDELALKLTEEWAYWVDCDRKCPRVNICEFTEPHPYHKEKHKEKYCGFMQAFIQNFIGSTFRILKSLEEIQYENYFNGLFQLVEFAYQTETLFSISTNKMSIEWWGEYASSIFTTIATLRNYLNATCESWKYIEGINVSSGVLFVEGISEKIFIDKIAQSGFADFLGISVKSYDGSANRRPGRITMLIKDLQEKGYTVYIQGDNDGKSVDIFQDLKTKLGIDDDRTFSFKHDFESSIPPQFLYIVLDNLYGISEQVTQETFYSIVEKDIETTPVHFIVKNSFNIDIQRNKTDIAYTLGELVKDFMIQNNFVHPFYQTELGRFVKFVMEVR